jgi:D-alanyl-lipoteichoic acid acyltransferase DltB (MBOAT superfamily)
MLYGYFMKMILADRIATVVDTVYDPVGFVQYSGFVVLIAAALFSVQIYCDFAGYTYIDTVINSHYVCTWNYDLL